MNNEKKAERLKEGIDLLCRDEDANKLIAPRYEEIISLLERYTKEIETFNDAYGLVKVADTEELITRHILDSLAPLGIIYKLLNISNTSTLNPKPKTLYPNIADAGSGAGLPGIPLAIVLPNCNFTLIERMGRRAGFLFNTKAVLSLNNVAVEENQLESVNDQFDLITFRAFSPIDKKLLKTLLNKCTDNGVIAAYKGKREKIEQEMKVFTNCKWEAVPYSVPFLNEGERHLLILEKTSFNDPGGKL